MRPLNHRPVFAAPLLLLLTAQAASPQPVAPPEKLEIRLLVTAEIAKVFRPAQGSGGGSPVAEPVKVVTKGQKIAAVVYFQGCKPNMAGNCNVDLDIKGVDPHGVSFQEHKGSPLWPNKPAPHAGMTQLGASYLNLQFEPKDPPGLYRILAVAHDRVSGTESRAEASFEVK